MGLAKQVITQLRTTRSPKAKRFEKFLRSKYGVSFNTHEEFNQWVLDRQSKIWLSCKECSLHKECKRVCFGSGDPGSSIMVVLPRPSKEDDVMGEPSGKGKELVLRLLEKAGFPRKEVYFTNVVACRPRGGKEPSSGQVKSCSPRLDLIARTLRPKVIFFMGSDGMKALELGGNLSHHVGEVDRPDWDGRCFGRLEKVILTYSPARILLCKDEVEKRDLVREMLSHFRLAGVKE